MVVKEKFKGENTYRCEECGFHFRHREKAERCEKNCQELGACDSEIVENSLERENR